jgi:hypothetical protein
MAILQLIRWFLQTIAGLNQTFEVRADVTFPAKLTCQSTSGFLERKCARLCIYVTINRFPILVNHATTGHKLQCQTKSNLCISNWLALCCQLAVVPGYTRVKTLKELFLRKPFRESHDFSHNDHLIQMLA